MTIKPQSISIDPIDSIEAFKEVQLAINDLNNSMEVLLDQLEAKQDGNEQPEPLPNRYLSQIRSLFGLLEKGSNNQIVVTAEDTDPTIVATLKCFAGIELDGDGITKPIPLEIETTEAALSTVVETIKEYVGSLQFKDHIDNMIR